MNWRVRSATLADGLARGFADPAHDDSDWLEASLPFEFQLHGLPPLGWFRGRLATPCRITGCDSKAVVFAEGREVARLDGPYDACVARGAVAVYIEEEPERRDWVTRLSRWATHNDIYGWKRTVRGVHGNWDCKRADLRSGGWWRAPVEADGVRVRSQGSSVVVEGPGDLVVRLQGVVHHGHGRLSVPVSNPPRWSTWDRGGPAFVDVDVNGVVHEVAFRTIEMGSTPRWRDFVADTIAYLDAYVLRWGLWQPDHSREFWRLRLNGEPLFLRGTNYISDLHPEKARDFERDVALMREANLNFVRVHGHVEPRDFYRACARAGLLVVQDLPFQWGYAPSIRPAAARAARAIVEELRDEPSIAVWNVHNEPMPWDLLGLDRMLVALVRRLDPTRPVVAGCGYAGVTMHAYSGWYVGTLADLKYAKPAACMEIGAQALPANGTDLACAQMELLEKFAGPFGSVEELRGQSQEYQEALTQIGLEHFRRLKPRCRALASFLFADGNPAVTWSVLDYDRHPKPAFEALKRSMQPVLASIERYDFRVPAGGRIGGPVVLVNDLREEPQVRVVVRCNGEVREFGGVALNDRGVRLGEVWFDAAGDRPTIELEVYEGTRLISRNSAWWRAGAVCGR